MDRRSFFRQLMMRGLDRAEQAGQTLGQRYQQLEKRIAQPDDASSATGQEHRQSGQSPTPRPASAPIERFLRPPGALPEADFIARCTACGECVAACPAEAIVIDPHQAGGRPYIQPRVAPCAMCLDVSCTKACPSGALTPMDSPMTIRIGKAKLIESRCLRTPAQVVRRGAPLAAEDCTVCISQCPAGEAALGLDEQGTLTVRDGCTGCGVCERACPTEPASIFIQPLTALA